MRATRYRGNQEHASCRIIGKIKDKATFVRANAVPDEAVVRLALEMGSCQHPIQGLHEEIKRVFNTSIVVTGKVYNRIVNVRCLIKMVKLNKLNSNSIDIWQWVKVKY